jgi:DNA-binding GntR family transcriptional regulator
MLRMGMDDEPGETGPVMKAVARRTLGDHVYEQVRDAIMKGEIPGGTEINQVELAKSLNVSRVPVREALRRLQAERLLEANPFQRFVVTKLSPDQIIELYDLRVELEIFAALRARRREGFFESELPAAREAAARLDLGMEAGDWIQADIDFHRAINGRDSAVASIIDEVRFRIYRYLHLAEPDMARRKEVLVEHQQILDVLQSGDDEEVRATISEHVAHTRDRLIRLNPVG